MFYLMHTTISFMVMGAGSNMLIAVHQKRYSIYLHKLERIFPVTLKKQKLYIFLAISYNTYVCTFRVESSNILSLELSVPELRRSKSSSL